MKKLGFSLFLMGLLSTSNAMAMSLSTVAINDYTSNGGGGNNFNFNWCTSDADTMASKAASYGWTVGLKSYNTAATYWTLTTSSAYCNSYDLCYFGGHGSYTGPSLGNKVGYNYDYGTHLWMTPYENSYRWADGNLKWMVMQACETLADGITNGSGYNWWGGTLRIQRWMGMFNKNGHSRTYAGVPGGAYWLPDGSLHAICGARSLTYSGYNSPGSDFIDRCLRASSTSVGQSWLDSIVDQEYYRYPGKSGIEPAVLCAYQNSTGYDWFNESLKSPVINPGQCDPSSMDFYFHNAHIGTPEYSTWNHL